MSPLRRSSKQAGSTDIHRSGTCMRRYKMQNYNGPQNMGASIQPPKFPRSFFFFFLATCLPGWPPSPEIRTALDLNFRYGTCKEFLSGVACGLARVCGSSSHLNFRCARSHVALGSDSSWSMCRQSLRQSACTMRSAAGRPNFGRCQPR